MLLRDAATAGGDGDTGVLLLGADDGVEMTNDAADRWLDELDAGGRTRCRRWRRSPADAPPTWSAT